MAHLTPDDHTRISAAVTAAEEQTAGEIVTIVAAQSDPYHDVALHWIVLGMLLVLALLAWQPALAERAHALVAGERWDEAIAPQALLTTALVLLAIAFLLFRLVFAWMPLRLAVTPGATEARRVRRRALALFRAGAEKRTTGLTGVLIYLSLAERRAEIIADAAIHAQVAPEAWGSAMAALLGDVREGRIGDGMVAAVREVGALLAQHFPRAADDVNELPDRVIEL